MILDSGLLFGSPCIGLGLGVLNTGLDKGGVDIAYAFTRVGSCYCDTR